MDRLEQITRLRHENVLRSIHALFPQIPRQRIFQKPPDFVTEPTVENDKDYFSELVLSHELEMTVVPKDIMGHSKENHGEFKIYLYPVYNTPDPFLNSVCRTIDMLPDL